MYTFIASLHIIFGQQFTTSLKCLLSFCGMQCNLLSAVGQILQSLWTNTLTEINDGMSMRRGLVTRMDNLWSWLMQVGAIPIMLI